LPIIVWSVVLAVALYPVFNWLAAVLGGRRKLAAALITILGLMVVIGPVTWLGLGLTDGVKWLIARFDSGKMIPPPLESVKDWPLVGQQLYDFWALTSTNLRSAVTNLLPQLQPLGWQKRAVLGSPEKRDFCFCRANPAFGKRRINVCATTVPARKRPNSHLHRKGTKRGRVAHFAAELNTGYGELHIFWVRKSICLDLNRVERIRSRQA
jgi:hypothetical protein